MNDKNELIKFLNSQKLMAISTYAPWIAIVYYVIDDDLNIYFISDPKSIHGKDIGVNKSVSCAIYDSEQKASDKKVGAQMQGEVSVVSGVNKLKWFFNMWSKICPSSIDKVNYKNYNLNILSSKVYRITPKKIRFFNENLYKNTSKMIEF